MKLNHLDLQVNDVRQTSALFERVFGLRIHSNRASPAIAILSDEGGFTLVLQKMKEPEGRYPEGFHVGFLVDELSTVKHAQQAIRAEGWEVSELIQNNRGAMIYGRAPEGYYIEVSVRPALMPA